MNDRLIQTPVQTENIFCGFSCQHPSVWSAAPVSIAAYPNVDFAPNNSNWVCEDSDGNAIPDGQEVGWGGVCELRCDGGTLPAATNTLTCSRWYRPRGHFQWWKLHDLNYELMGDADEGIP